jgi:hypothetical protein
MLFNSIVFLIFFTVTFFLFYFLNGTGRKILLFVASSIFYMWFIPVYVLILYLTILIDYFSAIGIENSTSSKAKKRHLLTGVINTCLVLFVFKYYNFFIDNYNFLGSGHLKHWQVILPIGLSFHVFQSLSYVIEVYRGNIKAEKNLLVYSNFVMMFPQLVAGPIERANNLLPQLKKCDHKIQYSDFMIGFSRFIWGLFKKVVVADTASIYVDAVYNNYTHHSGPTLILATLLFAVQIYCDFSGYSDMAIGVARMLGFRFKENFALPYFSKSITEFWRRWHISLSTWLRDYLYISFGGSRKGKFRTYINLMLTMLIGGLWHGASWNFVIWGGLNGLYLSVEKALGVVVANPRNFLIKLAKSSLVFILICFTWVFFRAATFSQANVIFHKMLLDHQWSHFNPLNTNMLTSVFASIGIMLLTEYAVLRKKSFDSIYSLKRGGLLLAASSVLFFLYIILFGNSEGGQFIYFQF